LGLMLMAFATACAPTALAITSWFWEFPNAPERLRERCAASPFTGAIPKRY
jgi:hypothetical protein